MPILFICPETSFECIHEKKYAGKVFQCMHCGQNHRVPGLDIDKYTGDSFQFKCEESNAEFPLKNQYYGERFHCPKCKNYHIGKPIDQREDLTGLTPDIAPIEISETDIDSQLNADRKRSSERKIKPKKTNSKLKKKSSIKSGLKSISSTITMSAEEETAFLHSAPAEAKPKRSFKLAIIIGAIVIPLIFAITYFLDNSRNSSAILKLTESTELYESLKFRKALIKLKEAILDHESKWLFFKNNLNTELESQDEYLNKSFDIYERHEVKLLPLLESTVKIHDLHKYHNKLIKEINKGKMDSALKRYLKNNIEKALAKEKELIKEKYSKEISLANKSYQEGALQKSFSDFSLTFRSWKLLDHKEIKSLHLKMLSTKIFFDKREKIISDITDIEDSIDHMGSAFDSIDNLNEAKRNCQLIRNRLDDEDIPLLKKIEKIEKTINLKFLKTKQIVRVSSDTTGKLNDQVAVGFKKSIVIFRTALSELDDKVIVKAFSNKAVFSTKRFDFALLPTLGNNYTLKSNEFQVTYEHLTVNYIPKLVILHFHSLKNSLTEQTSKDINSYKLRNLKFPYTSIFQLITGQFAMTTSDEIPDILIDGKLFKRNSFNSPKVDYPKIFKKGSVILKGLKDSSLAYDNQSDLWISFRKLLQDVFHRNTERSNPMKLAVGVVFSTYSDRLFPDLPDILKKYRGEFAEFLISYKRKLETNYIYLSEDKSILKVISSFSSGANYKSIVIYNKITNKTKVITHSYFEDKTGLSFNHFVPLAYSNVYEGNVADTYLKEKPIAFETMHPSLGIIATYNVKDHEFISDKMTFAEAITSSYKIEVKNFEALNLNIEPYCLSLDSMGYVNSIITRRGQLSYPDFREMDDLKSKKLKYEWLVTAAKVLYKPRELHLLFQSFYINENASNLRSIPELVKSLKGSRKRNHRFINIFDRFLIKRIIGDELDLAKIYRVITRMQRRNSYVLVTPNGPVCCWVYKNKEDQYCLNILKASAPLFFKSSSLPNVLKKAFGNSHTDVVPFDPNIITILIEYADIPGDFTYRVDSKILLDQKLFSKFYRNAHEVLKAKSK